MRGLHLKVFILVVCSLAACALSAFSQTPLIGATNSIWKFYTNAAGYNVDPGFGTTWKDAGFDDSEWPTGRGLFGIDAGYPYPFNTPIPGPSAGGPITVYYRIHFNWPNSPTGVILTGTNYVDDGNVIYLNGVEINRFTMNPGDPAWDTVAPATVAEPIIVPMDIPLDAMTNGLDNPLVMGDNLLTVEVHNQSSGSSDHVFGLWLRASQQICPTTDNLQPTNRIVAENSSTTFIVNGGGVPSPTIQWYQNVGAGDVLIAGATAASYTITNMTPGDAGEYFARLQNTCATPVDSHRAVVTFQADTTAPTFLSAHCGTAADDIIIELSEPLLIDNGQGETLTDVFNWTIEKIAGPGIDPGNPANVAYTPDTTTIVLTASTGSVDPLATYRVVLLKPMLDRAAIPNTLPENSAVTNECPQTISVRANGAGPFTFNNPPFASQFTTFVWAGAANGAGDTLAAFEPKVQLLDATTITMPLASVAGAPPAAASMSQYASAGKYLITRPTGVEGCVILANLRNDSGEIRTALNLSYNLTVEIPVVEELLGHYVYYSMTGAPDTWLRVPGISGDGTPGLKKGSLDLSADPWTVGSPLYILWVDDNGSGSPDNANEIDNIVFSHAGPALTISYSSPNITISWRPPNGVLQFKDNITGAWADVTPQPAAGGPYTVAASAAHRFYSLRQ